MGSKSRIPPSHMRRPLPGPSMVHPDPYGPGIRSAQGVFPPFDVLPPPEVMEQKLAAQHAEMQKLATENQRLAATHGILRQELAAAQHEIQILHAQIGAIKSEREQRMRVLMDKIPKMEAELQKAESVRSDLQKGRTEAQNLVTARDELMSKVRQLTQDIQRARSDVQQIPILMSELESLRQEYQQCRATYDYEKKFYSDHLESLQAMEKNYMNMAREVEKLRAELMNSPNVDRRAGGQYGGTARNTENEAPAYRAAQNPYEDSYAVQQQGHVALSAATISSLNSAAMAHGYVGPQAGLAPLVAGYDPHRPGPAYDPHRGPTYDMHRGSGYIGVHGQMAPVPQNSVQYGSVAQPARGGHGYDATPRGGNPNRK